MKLELKLGFFLLLYHLVGLGQVQATLTLSPGPCHTPLSSLSTCSLEITALKGFYARVHKSDLDQGTG